MGVMAVIINPRLSRLFSGLNGFKELFSSKVKLQPTLRKWLVMERFLRQITGSKVFEEHKFLKAQIERENVLEGLIICLVKL